MDLLILEKRTGACLVLPSLHFLDGERKWKEYIVTWFGM